LVGRLLNAVEYDAANERNNDRSNTGSGNGNCGATQIGMLHLLAGYAVVRSVVVHRHGLRLREVCWDARRHMDDVFLSSRHSLELRILLDCQGPMKDFALNDSRAI
jgi:hypothetical protein